jgi:LacI family transcriptional regulator
MTAASRKGRANRVPSGAPTIKLVADRAGVSIATVSRVFADPEAVSDILRRRVEEAARTLNYRPSRVARTLRVGTSQAVGVVIPDLENPFFTAVVRGIEVVLQAAGYTLLLGNSDEDVAREREVMETLRADGVAGIIFVPINDARDAYQEVLAPPLQVVAVDRSPMHFRPDLVTVDNVAGTRAAVEHLFALGHKEVALLGGPLRHSTAKERERGYQDALRAAGRPIRADLIYYGDFKETGGYEGMKALMALPKRPSAVFVANNLMTLGAFRAVHEEGLRMNPPLTAVSQPSQEIGSSAAGLLLDRIARPERSLRHVILDTSLVVRKSCGASSPKARSRAAAPGAGKR